MVDVEPTFPSGCEAGVDLPMAVGTCQLDGNVRIPPSLSADTWSLKGAAITGSPHPHTTTYLETHGQRC